MKQLLMFLSVLTLVSSPIFAQGHGHGGGHHGMWPDSMQTVTLTGTAIVDSTYFMPMYYLDTNNDNNADYHLSFGPYWYKPATGASRPTDGEVITIQGAEWGFEQQFRTIMVYEINGLKWRKPIEGGTNGWDGDHFWGDQHDQVTVTGTALIDSTYYYQHYFLDEDGDGIPDYVLNFGPPWYLLENEALLPDSGDVITVVGGTHDMGMMNIPSLMVYELNGQKWRDSVGPPPWSGNWMHRNDNDTSYVFTPSDSLDWMGHPPGLMMGNMMGGGFFPDSIYCQFEEMYPDFLPGQHDSTMFAGYYMNMYDPGGQTMMGRSGMMGGMGPMRFNRPTTFQFHYDDDHLRQLGLSDAQINVKYWNESISAWVSVNYYQLDADKNTITFQNDEMYTYYALFGSTILTGIAEDEQLSGTPDKFALYQNYPNPFNPETTIRFELAKQGKVKLTIYDLLGRQVVTLLDREVASGSHQLKWNGKDAAAQSVPTGVYLMQLTVGNKKQVKKLSLVK